MCSMTKLIRFLIICLVLSQTAGCSPQRGYEALLLLADVSAGNEASRLKKQTLEPERTQVRISGRKGFIDGDLYLPGESPQAGILLVPGIAEEGKNDPRLMALARSLARARMVVLVPDLESLRQLEVSQENVDEIAAVFEWFRSRDDLVSSERFGLMAFSYAVGPTLIAAMKPELAEDVDFVVGVGGYYDLQAVMTFFTTGWFHDGERWRKGEPNRYGKWVFIQSNLHRLSHPGDREQLRKMAERRMHDPDAKIADLASALSPEGESLYRFITNDDRRKAMERIENLPGFLVEQIRALDPSERSIQQLKAHLILIHGLDDSIIPYTESVKLKKSLPPDQVELFLVHGLMHVDVSPGLLGSWRMWRAVMALLRERDGVR